MRRLVFAGQSGLKEMREDRIFRLSSILLLTGISLICLVIFTPNGLENQAPGSFFKVAMSSPWGKWSDLAAAWCSFKIILLSLGLFLAIDVLGTALLVQKHNKLVRLVYALHIAPGLGVLFGGCCLIKALL